MILPWIRNAITATNSATPSTSAAAMIMAVWIRAVASGWRAMPSVADPPMRPMPMPAPTHGESGGEARADEAESLVRAGGGGVLQQSDHGQHGVLPREVRR